MTMTITPPNHNRKEFSVRYWWLTPVILATWNAEIRRIKVQVQPREIVGKTLSPK
jgi:hypothetical protein